MPNLVLASDLEGREIADCRLVRRIGTGGTGDVYLAEQHRLGNRPVAVKIVRPREDVQQPGAAEDVSRHFLREGQLLASFSHPNILPVHDSGREGDLLYLVMQYVPEGSLADELRGRARHPLHPPLPLSQVVSMVDQIAAALQYTHDHGVVHRDVKPGNVLVQVRPDGQRHLWLADFGIAGGDDESTVLLNQVSGTARYMAPEQFGGRFSPASDQYSLAIIAYQLLTGRPPFVGPAAQLVHEHLHTPPPSLRAFNPAVSAAVEAVVLRGLAKHPQQRYPSVADFAQALRAAAAADIGTTVADRAASAAPLVAGVAAASAGAAPGGSTTRPLPSSPRITGGQQPHVYTGTTEAATPLAATTPALRPYAGGAAVPPRRRVRVRSALLALGLGLFLVALLIAAVSAWRSGVGLAPTDQSGPSGPMTLLPTATAPAGAGSGQAGSSGGQANTPAPSATAPAATQPPPAQTTPAQVPPATQPAAPSHSPLYAPVKVEPSSSADAAKLVTLTVPATAAPGQHLNATLVLQNTGTSTWTTPSGYRLTCDMLRHPESSCVPGMYVGFDGYTIRPGDTLTYTVALTAPPTPGPYVVWLNMEHGTSLFPTPDVLVRLVVVPPTPTPTAGPSSAPTSAP